MYGGIDLCCTGIPLGKVSFSLSGRGLTCSGIIYDLDPERWSRQPTEPSPRWLDSKEFLDQRGYWNDTMITAFATGYPKALPRSFFADVEGRSFETRVLVSTTLYHVWSMLNLNNSQPSHFQYTVRNLSS